jgi:hypothetical protein
MLAEDIEEIDAKAKGIRTCVKRTTSFTLATFASEQVQAQTARSSAPAASIGSHSIRQRSPCINCDDFSLSLFHCRFVPVEHSIDLFVLVVSRAIIDGKRDLDATIYFFEVLHSRSK